MRDTVNDYDSLGEAYSANRREDSRIATELHNALGKAQSILNVGAGAGSYEPADRYVIAIEPSQVMRKQRPPHRVPAIAGTADSIPFDDNTFDVSMAVLTIHHWPNLDQCLMEVRRVTMGRIVIMTFDPKAETDFWLGNYAPELLEVETARYPNIEEVAAILGGNTKSIELPVHSDCSDGFQVALYSRPEEFLKPEVRASQSAWKFLPDGIEQEIVARLRSDLANGEWDRKYGRFRTATSIKCQLRVVINEK